MAKQVGLYAVLASESEPYILNVYIAYIASYIACVTPREDPKHKCNGSKEDFMSIPF